MEDRSTKSSLGSAAALPGPRFPHADMTSVAECPLPHPSPTATICDFLPTPSWSERGWPGSWLGRGPGDVPSCPRPPPSSPGTGPGCQLQPRHSGVRCAAFRFCWLLGGPGLLVGQGDPRGRLSTPALCADVQPGRRRRGVRRGGGHLPGSAMSERRHAEMPPLLTDARLSPHCGYSGC